MMQLKNKWLWIFNLIVTASIAITIAILMKFIPFGGANDRTLLTIDLSQQYVDFFSLYQEAFTKDPRLFLYSFQKGIGGEMIGLWAYYLMSPFNLLLLFFEREHLDLAVSLITFTKLLAISTSFYYFCQKKYQLSPLYNILFSQAYTFMSYTLVYQLNIMWLDGMIFLPLIALGLHQLVRQNKPLLYVISLSLAMISHYYIAYMICLFLITYTWFVIYEDKPDMPLKFACHDYLRFIKYSLISALLSSFLLLPTLVTTLKSKSAQADSPLDLSLAWKTKFSPMELFGKFFMGAFDYDELANGSANLYVGLFALLLVFLYYFNRQISLKEKLLSLALLLFYFLSLTWEFLDKLWHLGQFPIWYNSRFSFLLCFFLLILAIRSLQHTQSISLPKVFISLVFFAMVSYFYAQQTELSYLNDQLIFYSFSLVLVYLFLLYLRPHMRKLSPVFMLLLCLVELTSNGVHLLTELDHYVRPASLHDYIHTLDEVMAALPREQQQFYRVHKTFSRTKNESLFNHYYGLNHFGSTLEAATIRLYSYLGLPQTSNSIHYTSGTLFTDDFFNVKYLIDITSNTNMYTKEDGYPLYRHSSNFDIRAHTHLQKGKRVIYYENTELLGIGMEVSPQIISTKFVKNRPIENQEKLLQLIDFDGPQKPYYTKEELIDPTYINLEISNKGDGDYYTYQRQKPNLPASFTLTFHTTSKNPYYFTFPSHYSNKKVTIQLNSKEYDFYSPTNSRQIADAAFGKANKDFLLRVNLKKDKFTANLIHLYEFDLQAYQALIKRKAPSGLALEHYQENSLKGSINIQQNHAYILTSIPYDPAWKIKVDGKAVKGRPVLNDTLLAIPVTKGDHQIEMIYLPDSLLYGLGVSMLALMFFVWDLRRIS